RPTRRRGGAAPRAVPPGRGGAGRAPARRARATGRAGRIGRVLDAVSPGIPPGNLCLPRAPAPGFPGRPLRPAEVSEPQRSASPRPSRRHRWAALRRRLPVTARGVRGGGDGVRALARGASRRRGRLLLSCRQSVSRRVAAGLAFADGAAGGTLGRAGPATRTGGRTSRSPSRDPPPLLLRAARDAR